MNRTQIWICLIIVIGGLLGCSKEDPQSIDIGYAYFPTEVGKYVDYRVDSMFIDEQSGLGAAAQVEYELRELIADEFVDQAGRTVQRIERFVKDSTGSWVIRDVWTQHRNAFYGERVEENHRKLRMAFKPSFSKRWNLNSLTNDAAFVPDQGAGNAIPEVEMQFEEIDEPYFINGFSFDSTVTVNTTYPSNLVVTLIERERFAKGVGLIEKLWVEINSQYNGNPNVQAWEKTGFEVRYTLIGYGEI